MKQVLIQHRGFTLVEALVAITVLLVAIVGPMSIAAQGLQASFYAREEATALYLAQESLEALQYRRNQSVLSELYQYGSGSVEAWIQTLCLLGYTPGPESPYVNFSDPTACDEYDMWAWYTDLPLECHADDVTDEGCDFDKTYDDGDDMKGAFIGCNTINGPSGCILNYHTLGTNGYYTYEGGGTLSQFTRKIYLNPEPHVDGDGDDNDEELKVTVEVSWQSTLYGADTSSVVLQTRIFNAYE